MTTNPFTCPCGAPSYGTIDIKASEERIGRHCHLLFCEEHLNEADKLLDQLITRAVIQGFG